MHRLRNLTGVFAVVLSVAMIPAMLFSTTSADAQPALPTLTPIPASRAGTHGFPYDFVPQTPLVPGAPAFNFSALGYAEQEYLMSGTTNIYKQSGSWSSNGRLGRGRVAEPTCPTPPVSTPATRPTPSKFNGTVVVEWSNAITGGDEDTVWSEIDNELLTNGYAYIRRARPRRPAWPS